MPPPSPRFTRWATPVSDVLSLAMVSLVDDGSLKVTVEDVRSATRDRFVFAFDRCIGYRNLLEEYRTAAEHVTRASAIELGWTRISHGSPWLSELQREPLFELHGGNSAVHYIVFTEDDVVEIVSTSAPRILALGATPPDARPAGKSRVLLHPQDRAQIDPIIEDAAQRRPPRR